MTTLRRRIVELVRRLDDRRYDGRGPQRVLFVLPERVGAVAAAPVIEELAARDGVVVRYTALADEARLEGALDALHVPPGRARWQKWHQVVNTHLNAFHPARNALRVYLHHGSAFGNRGTKKAPAEWCDIYLGSSESERGFLERAVGPLFRDRLFFAVGMPKTDRLARPAPPSDARRRLRIPDRTTIVIASHWLPEGLLPTLGSEPFERLSTAFPDANVVQTAHPWTFSRPHADRARRAALREALRGVARERHNAYVRFDVPADQVLPAADMLICDHSSLLVEYMLLDRPVCFFDNPENWFDDSDIAALYRASGERFASAADIVEMARRALATPRAHATGRAAMRRYFLANAGVAAKAAADALTSVGPVCTTSGPAWQRLLTALSESSHAHSRMRQACATSR